MPAAATPDSEPLVAGRDAFDERSWERAYEGFEAADRVSRLGPEDLELLATSAYMVGMVGEMLDGFERAYNLYIEDGRRLPAARVALWLASNYASRGKLTEASGWVERGRRIVESVDDPAVERGYMLLPGALRQVMEGRFESVVAASAEAADIGRRFADQDLVALASQTQGRALLHLGKSDDGFRLFDEVMVSVTGGECSPMVSGIVYCSVVEGCYEAHDIRRAAVWTEALTTWCGSQEGLVAFTDQCLAHRAEILRHRGDFDAAWSEAVRSLESGARGGVAAQAHYQMAEIARIRGDYTAAEASYGEVSARGGEAQPGLALLRMRQGNHDAAVASISRARDETADRLATMKLLPGYVEVMIETGSIIQAEEAVARMADTASLTGTEMHRAWAAEGAGRASLARSDHTGAASGFREALALWDQLRMPYEGARSQAGLAAALLDAGDRDGAKALVEAARATFHRLGAAPDLSSLERLSSSSAPAPFGLTGREIEVLSKLAGGATNREIAAELVLSERTIDRHVSNIFTKMGVGTRSAATARAIREHIV